jgi:CheY-like chemotaxis protein
MFKVLIADDEYEDRELLKLEIRRAVGDEEADLRFVEAASVKQAKTLLTSQVFDLLTLDIEFDRLNEGIDALPEIFENHPTLNIIVISGKLDKGEVSSRLFRFTKDNVFKSKRWARHFDVLDKKDDKTEALRRAYLFAVQQRKGADTVRDLFLLAESYLEKNLIDKCLEVYHKIQLLAPGEPESQENIRMASGMITPEEALELYRRGDNVAASLLLGYAIERQLKAFTTAVSGQCAAMLSDCVKELEQGGRFSAYKKGLFYSLMRLRNKAVHQPAAVTAEDFDAAVKNLKLLEETIS